MPLWDATLRNSPSFFSITRIDAAEVPKSLQKPRSTFFKFFTPGHKLSVVASQLQPRVVVDSHLSILLDKMRLTTRGEFKYEVSRSGVFSLAFRLPAGFARSQSSVGKPVPRPHPGLRIVEYA